MATVTHYIYSHYNPSDAQPPAESTDTEDSWEKEPPRLNRLQGNPPRFVPATLPYNDWSYNQPSSSKGSTQSESANTLGTSLSGWYRSLTNSNAAISESASSSDKPYHETQSCPLVKVSTPVNKNNWFIMSAIQSELSTPTSTPSLAEMLERDPPPLPSEKKYTPPVWLEIGPANKGFGMLQRAGWNEGEALGPAVVRKKPLERLLPDELFETKKDKGKAKASRDPSHTMILRKETVEIKLGDSDDVVELQHVDVIDLTICSDDDLSDSASSAEDTDIHEETLSPGKVQPSPIEPISDNPAYEPKALLTPIPTVLKSDRLGIGLKAKTVGPYNASQKRVTHNAAALAAHTKTAEESRKRKGLFGQGRRGLAKQHEKEERRRQAMIAYLKSSPYSIT